MKRAYFSDVHMGKRVPMSNGKYHPHNYVWLDAHGKKGAFRNFLDYLCKQPDIGEVIMVGDILDNWVIPIDVMPPSFEEILTDTTPVQDDKDDALTTNADIVASLRKLSDKKGVEVIYLPGNHDMGIDKATIKKFFPNMVFGGNHQYGLQYVAGAEVAEHGTSQALFNGPDQESDPNTSLPMGYFISRIAATMEAKKGKSVSLPDIIKGLLGPGDDLAQKAFNTVVEAAGLKREDRIMIGKHPIFDPDGDGYITIGEVRTRYGDIYSRYQAAYNNRLRPNPPLFGARVDASNVELMVDTLNKENGTHIVIMGHTHDQRLTYHPEGGPYLYANCGAWCNKPNAMQLMNGHFVVTETSGGQTKVMLKYWDDEAKKPKDGANTIFSPRPQDPLGKYI